MDTELKDVSKFYNIIIEFFANYSLQLIGALIIIIIGIIASKYVQKLIFRVLTNYKIDETLSRFISSFVRFLVIAMMVVLALGKLGISIAPFIAALGALSLTAGLALQGSVSNFAAGMILIITKPFKIEDTITIHDVYGEVEDIKLSYTILKNEDGEQITIPNKYMIGDVLVNSFAYRIVEGSISISYRYEVENAISIIKGAIINHDGVNSKNEPIVGIENFNDYSISVGYRYWVPTKLFFKTQYDVNLKIINALNNASITIPPSAKEIKIIGDVNVSK